MESGVRSGLTQQHAARNDARNVAEDDDKDTFSFSPPARKEETDAEHGGSHDDAGRDAQENGLVGGVTETFQDQTGEVGLQTVCHVVTEYPENQHPDFDVAESFLDLGFLVMNILDTGSIILKAFDGDNAFAFRQPGGREGRIGQQPPQTDSKKHSENSEEDEHPLVWKHSIDL